jgi:hypothetical protein
MMTEQMLEIVDAYFKDEAAGNTALLKYSLIAVCAAKSGYDASDYDFRRNADVRNRIEELKNTNGAFCDAVPAVYKSLDVEEFIRNNRGVEQLKKALSELDAYWMRVFEHAAKVTMQNRSITKAKKELAEEFTRVAGERGSLYNEKTELTKQNRSLTLENRYLRSMLKTYLYPSVANEILKSEHVHVLAETQITEKTAQDFSELKHPKSFEESVAGDRKMLSEEEQILEAMWEQCDV